MVKNESNKNRVDTGLELQRELKNSGLVHLELKGLVKDIDFYIGDEIYFYSFKEKFISIFEDNKYIQLNKNNRIHNLINKNYNLVYDSFDCISFLNFIASIDELSHSLIDESKIFELNKFLSKVKNVNGSENDKILKLKGILDKYFKSDIVLWLKNLPNIIFIFEVETSYRNDRGRSKEKHSKFFEKPLKQMGFDLFYVYLLPNDDYYGGYNSQKKEEKFIESGKEFMNERLSEILDIEEEVRLLIQEDNFYKFLDFLVILGSSETLESIECKFKKQIGLDFLY